MHMYFELFCSVEPARYDPIIIFVFFHELFLAVFITVYSSILSEVSIAIPVLFWLLIA